MVVNTYSYNNMYDVNILLNKGRWFEANPILESLDLGLRQQIRQILGSLPGVNRRHCSFDGPKDSVEQFAAVLAMHGFSVNIYEDWI